jgi:hypothetical protein
MAAGAGGHARLYGLASGRKHVCHRFVQCCYSKVDILDSEALLLSANKPFLIISYGGLIIKAMGFTNFKAIEMAMPASAISVVVMLSSGLTKPHPKQLDHNRLTKYIELSEDDFMVIVV